MSTNECLLLEGIVATRNGIDAILLPVETTSQPPEGVRRKRVCEFILGKLARDSVRTNRNANVRSQYFVKNYSIVTLYQSTCIVIENVETLCCEIK